MAFGTGPRNCVGMRFAMEELKMAICTVVQKFRFFPVAETPVRNLLVNTSICLFNVTSAFINLTGQAAF